MQLSKPKILFISFFLITFSIYSQKLEKIGCYFNIEDHVIDTILLHDSLKGGPLCNYLIQWSINSNCPIVNGAYHYVFYDKMTEQDKLVFDSIPYYFKLYKNGNLILEGQKNIYGNLIGDIKYYRENGKLEKIEHYNVYIYSWKDIEVIPCDATNPEKTWKYYNEKGILEKEIEYQFLEDKGEIIKIKKTKAYNKNKKIKSIIEEKINNCDE